MLPTSGTWRSLLAIYPMTIPVDRARVLETGEFCNWLANGCHPLSLMLSLGGRVSSVTTLLGPGEQAVGVVYLQFASGASGVFHLAGGTPQSHAVEQYELFGDNRAISIENGAHVAYHRGIPFNYWVQRDFTAPGLDSGSVVWEANQCLATLKNEAIFVQGASTRN